MLDFLTGEFFEPRLRLALCGFEHTTEGLQRARKACSEVWRPGVEDFFLFILGVFLDIFCVLCCSFFLFNVVFSFFWCFFLLFVFVLNFCFLVF